MNKLNKMTIINLLITFLFLLCLSNTSKAEEKLISKQNDEYIGWQTSKTQFTTCYKQVKPIDGGRVVKTDEKCDNDHHLIKTGRITNIDSSSSTFQIKDDKGDTQTFYYNGVFTGKGIKLNEIKNGDSVTIISPIQGRAETIKK